ncbi:Sapep family Mn(2+)-dependent dipeptidase [Ruminococcaceae bacterium OttesenSCG-928-O06]|nr:Sapep family Mn(2+)-dependent dipeptidase [Ruminococcaceae bacterium OttesenSCG-928-O06]
MEEKDLLQQIDGFIEAHKEDMVRDIARLVAIPSVEGPAAEGAPYGAENRRALDAALAIAEGFGLATEDGDGHVGWAHLPGKEPGYIATITHLDVVPPGTEGWDGDPYVLRQTGDWILGRGVADDKGPSVLCLYAARFLQQANVPLRYGVRVLLGCCEETGMTDVDYYLAHNPQPLFAFSPDSSFPVCNGEKGSFGGEFVSAPLQGNMIEFSAGMAPNVIPATAACLVKIHGAPPPASDAVAVQEENGAARLTAQGIGGHAAFPEGSKNAIGLLVEYLLQHGLCSPGEEAFLQLLHHLHSSPYGDGLGIACRDDAFGALTINGGVVSLQGGRLRQSIDIRYPTATTAAALSVSLAEAAARHGATFVPGRSGQPFYIPANAAPIRLLLDTWNEVSGRADKPFTMGGGTYARHFQSAVSYGPGVEERELPAFAGPEHAPNEGVYLPDFWQALKVYILALVRLQKLDFA